MYNVMGIYREVHKQSFIPIFVDDFFDSYKLVDACVEAGFKCIEYTLRRRDAHVMIPWIKKSYPDLVLLVGSTIDDEKIVRYLADEHPQMLTIDELVQKGADGFVSMLGWSEQSIRKLSKTHLVIPSAMTVNEAFAQVSYGAHFIKLIGPDTSLVKLCRAEPAFGYCPIMITGGMTLETIPAAISDGAVLAASGFDLMLKNYSPQVDTSIIVSILKKYKLAVQKARLQVYPRLNNDYKDVKDWVASLPHYIPFM